MTMKHDHTQLDATSRPAPGSGPSTASLRSHASKTQTGLARRDAGGIPPCTRRAGFRGFLPPAPASRSADARVASGFTRLRTPPHDPAHTGKSLSRSGSGRGAGGQPQLCADPASPVGTERSLFSVPANAGHPQRRSVRLPEDSTSVRPSTPALFAMVTGAPCPISFTTSVCLSPLEAFFQTVRLICSRCELHVGCVTNRFCPFAA